MQPLLGERERLADGPGVVHGHGPRFERVHGGDHKVSDRREVRLGRVHGGLIQRREHMHCRAGSGEVSFNPGALRRPPFNGAQGDLRVVGWSSLNKMCAGM